MVRFWLLRVDLFYCHIANYAGVTICVKSGVNGVSHVTPYLGVTTGNRSAITIPAQSSGAEDCVKLRIVQVVESNVDPLYLV